MAPMTRSQSKGLKVKNGLVKHTKPRRRVPNQHGKTTGFQDKKRAPRGFHDQVTMRATNENPVQLLQNLFPLPAENRRVVGLWEYLWKNNISKNDVAHERIARSFQCGDLLNTPLLLWLMGIMTNGLWETIDAGLVPHFARIAELEDEITNLLQGEKNRPTPLPFDMRLASDFVLTLLSANFKVLCIRR